MTDKPQTVVSVPVRGGAEAEKWTLAPERLYTNGRKLAEGLDAPEWDSLPDGARLAISHAVSEAFTKGHTTGYWLGYRTAPSPKTTATDA